MQALLLNNYYYSCLECLHYRLNIHVEDETNKYGPIVIEIEKTKNLANFKKQVENEFFVPIDCQQWIISQTLIESNENFQNIIRKHNEILTAYLFVRQGLYFAHAYRSVSKVFEFSLKIKH